MPALIMQSYIVQPLPILLKYQFCSSRRIPKEVRQDRVHTNYHLHKVQVIHLFSRSFIDRIHLHLSSACYYLMRVGWKYLLVLSTQNHSSGKQSIDWNGTFGIHLLHYKSSIVHVTRSGILSNQTLLWRELMMRLDSQKSPRQKHDI